jgi:multicomponent Na+:H+ antiporter subunit G
VIEVVSIILILCGGFFFVAGSVGLLRFPDVLSRLHALTKADNVGLGFLVAGLALQAGSWVVAAKLFLIWFLVLVSSSVVCHLIANFVLESEGPAS